MSRTVHPGRSLDFLSRLHDGELSAAEKAHFEAHRAHCDECRKAAADFEATLAYYRTTGTSPAASDLSARILRRLQKTNRRRPAFGVVFGIDLRWAGAFTAALVAVILGASLVERQRAARSIPVSFATAPTPPGGMADALVKKEAPAAQTLERQTAAGSAKDRAAATPNASATSFQAPAAAPAPPADKTERIAAAGKGAAVPPAPAPKIAPKPARTREAGGEGAVSEEKTRRAPAEAANFDAISESVVLTAPARLTVTALDDGGLAPAVLNGAKIELSEIDRGRYVVTVGADGVPLDVVRESRPAMAKMIAASPTPTDRTLRALKELRFAPGSRARRLLAQVE
jgi:hypothetical protein